MYLHLFVIYKVFVHFLGTISCWSSWPLCAGLVTDLGLTCRCGSGCRCVSGCPETASLEFPGCVWSCVVSDFSGWTRSCDPFLWLLSAKIFSVSCQFTAIFCFHFIRAFSNFSSTVASVHLSPCIGCIRTLAPCLLLYIHLFWRCCWVFWSPEHLM